MFKKIVLHILVLFVGIGFGMLIKDYIFQKKESIHERVNTRIYSSENGVNTKFEFSNRQIKNRKNEKIGQIEIPVKVFEILNYISEHQSPPDGYVGGRMFKNLEGLLPKTSEQNKKIIYKEWDVNPKMKGKNRGSQRLVTSDNGNAYYSNDHYKSFNKIQ